MTAVRAMALRGRGASAQLLDHALSTAAAIALLCVALLVAGWLTGHRTLVDRGDSMRPALRAGDLVLNRSTPAGKVAVGDIVTFEDPARGRSVTHRVVARRPEGSRVAFVTRGDANTGSERWSAGSTERIGRLVASVPQAGRALGWLSDPLARLLFTATCALALCTLALRWIWRDA